MATYGMSVITAVVAQNTSGVRGFLLDPAFVAEQLDSVADEEWAYATPLCDADVPQRPALDHGKSL